MKPNGWSLALTAALAAFAPPPTSNAADALFVSDFTDGILYRVDMTTGVKTPIVTGRTLPEDGDCSPVSKLIYFAESNFGLLTRWTQTGGGETNIIPAAGAVDGPEGPSFDAAGNLYFNTRMIGFTAQGAWSVAGGDPVNPATPIVPPFTDFGEGSIIVVAGPHAGALLLVSRTDQTVYISEPPGAPLATFISSSGFPPDVDLYGIATNGCGEVFVAFTDFFNFSTSGVRRFDADGNFLDDYVTGRLSAQFLELDSAGNLYLADSDSGTVWKVLPDRTISALTTMTQPTGVAVCRDRQVPDCSTAITCDAGGPYLAECAGPETCLELDGTGSTGPALAYSWSTTCPAASFDDPTLARPTLCLASAGCAVDCLVKLTVVSGTQTRFCTAEIRVQDTLPPVLAGVPSDDTVECDQVPPPPAVTASDQCDPDVPVVFDEKKTPGRCPGEYVLTRTWSAADDCGHAAKAAQTLQVVDTTPPVVTPAAGDLGCLWPPNHWYVCYTKRDVEVAVEDACSDPVEWAFDGCASDQPDDARESDPQSPWNGDGHTTDDCVVLPGGEGFCVRAERAGSGPTAQDGRHYGVTVVAIDACGNVSPPALAGRIHVPHDQSPAEKSCRNPTAEGCRPNQSIPCAGK